MFNWVKFLASLFFLSFSILSFGQVAPASTKDTLREFEILRAPSLRSIKLDSVTTLQTLAGGAIVKQGNVIFSSDSAVINNTTHTIEAFGNIHINQADTLNTYSQYLKYLGVEKMAYLKKDVRLTDGKGTLLTQDLDYNMASGIGNFYNGGKVIENKTVITSVDGTYYADTKDVYFKKNVKLDGPKDHLRADSLLYNMSTKMSSFISKTNIKNADVEINTSEGTYDLKTGNAFFTSRTTVKDSSGRIYTADNMALDNKTGNAQMEGNAVVIDTSNNFVVIANQIFLNKKNNSFLATRKPVAIIIKDKDSTYIAGDTIFSGITTKVEMQKMMLQKDTVINVNLSENEKVHNIKNNDSTAKYLPLDSIQKRDSARLPVIINDSLPGKIKIIIDTLAGKEKLPSGSVPDTGEMRHPARGLADTFAKNLKEDTRIALEEPVSKESLPNIVQNQKREKEMKDSADKSDSSIRYFLAFHNVKIFNDSLQSVCDSMFYSTKDSTFRLYYDPVVWNGQSQLTGDTMFLFTENNKPKRVYAYEQTMVVNKTREGFFNQMSGKTLNAYFIDGKIDYVRVRGSQSESIHYMQEDDSSYYGMNRAAADVIELYFKKDELKRVSYVNTVTGNMYPMTKIPADQKELKNFKWLDARRPKTHLELFQ
ncbi:MAG: OstA-like protein [Ginsengibacter sp.]